MSRFTQEELSKSLRASLNDEQRQDLINLLGCCFHEAYLESGYEMVRFHDGSFGVLKANTRMMGVIEKARDHFMVGIGAAEYSEEYLKHPPKKAAYR